MVEETKEMMDIAAVSTGVLSLAAWLTTSGFIVYNRVDGTSYLGVRHSYGT